MSHYIVRPTTVAPPLDGEPLNAVWRSANVAQVNNFHKAGSDHKPGVSVRVMYDASTLYFLWDVEDRYVVCRATEYLGEVWKDSCVEFFVQPKADKGYFNFEINCGGALLTYYIEDPTRVPGGFAKFTKVAPEHGKLVRIVPSMPKKVDPEQPGPVRWRMGYAIPIKLLENYVGPIGNPAGQTWRGNFYKCADDSSHPHWGTWSPIGEELNFHQPKFFGTIEFAK